MSWGRGAQYLPNIPTYKLAKEKYENIRPIRGTGERRLGHRSDQNALLKSNTDGTYTVQLYGSNIITYAPDGTITVDIPNTWVNLKLAARLTPLLGRFFCVYDRRMWVTEYGSSYPLHSDKPTEFVGDDAGVRMKEPDFPVVHTIDRKKFNAIKKNYTAFRAYLKGLAKLDATAAMEEIAAAGYCSRLYELPDVAGTEAKEEFYPAALKLIHRTKPVYYQGRYVRAFKYALAAFDELLLQANPDVLVKHTRVTGYFVKDPNRKYLTQSK